ncbi:MAG: hypothetical protein AAF901_04855, partial [Bacteroidota bacterium]
PEWNDANNALVGNGVSMVTLYYLRRFLNFFKEVFKDAELKDVQVSKELVTFFEAVFETFKSNENILSGAIRDNARKSVLDRLGNAGSVYRTQVYEHAFSGRKSKISLEDIRGFTDIAIDYLEHAIKANKRSDNLYHAYNLMTVASDSEVSVSYLDEMLEGQVAALSSGALSSKEALALLDALKQSKLFRHDQYSYLLYPYKELKGFLERNTIPEPSILKSSFLQKLVEEGNTQVVEKDINGEYHFNGNFKNADDLKDALGQLKHSGVEGLSDEEESTILQVFEDLFNHKAFTGRSGTFYGYEGLGSIYWHMVSKLLLAVQECCLKAVREKESDEVIGRLLEHYYEINEGIGVHKSPELYGAFPTDPYSHTPAGRGAQQPGMTGQVKEDILSRFGELGVFVKNGQLYFDPCLLRKDEFLEEPKTLKYTSISGEHKAITIGEGSICFTYCQVPMVYTIAEDYQLDILFSDGSSKSIEGLSLDKETSRKVFERSEEVVQINVSIKENHLK